jgi:hypothetical protein
MRILELTLQNFAPILAGTGKEMIHLDLRGITTRINVIIGKIGSGKTYILSHLQPFATVGSLDIRNADDPIISGKDGYKMIAYEKDGSEYIIEHHYVWNGTNHAKKSYITKDDVELNPNGNISTFAEIVQMEFGIDQSFLRLVRIGPNVTNFINMKATERKSFIASLLKDTENYLTLYKYWSADLRTINTKVSILMNKLNSYGEKSLDELKEEMEDLEDKRKDQQISVDNLKQRKFQITAEVNNCLEGLSIKEFQKKKEENELRIQQCVSQLKELQSDLDSFKDYPDILDISKEIGKLESMLLAHNENLHKLSTQYEECSSTLHSLLDKKAISGDETHMQTLKDTYQELLKQGEAYERQLRNFTCSYSSAYLSSLLEEINAMNILVSEISQYDSEMIATVYQSDSSIIAYAKNKIEILTLRKIKVQKMMNNIQFSEKYEATTNLYFPPFCPTKSCPYYVTHPDTIQSQLHGKDMINGELAAYQEEIQGLDVEIYKYSDYPILYSKISSLKEYWRKIIPVLDHIHALKESDLKRVLTLSQCRVWYNYDQIIDTIDLIEKRDKYYQLTEKIKSIKNELDRLDLAKDAVLDSEISRLREEKNRLNDEIEKATRDCRDTSEKSKNFTAMYMELSHKSDIENRISQLKESYKELKETEEKYIHNQEVMKDNEIILLKLDREIIEANDSLKSVMSKMDAMRTKMNDISYTSKELEGLLQEQKWMTLMVDAVGSKKGIPMKMVEMFFNSCKDTINEMLYMVTEDEFELLDFNIGEKEFTIPYSVNGNVADDISKASQGQTSLVSIALSFALVKELGMRSGDTMNCYPIPLLDEPDGALHKTDKPKFISILMKYLDDIQSEQCFVITHSEFVFDGYPVQLIMTTEESVNTDRYENAIHV